MLIDQSKTCSIEPSRILSCLLERKKKSTYEKLLIQQKSHQMDIEGTNKMHEKSNLLIKKIDDIEKNKRTLLDQQQYSIELVSLGSFVNKHLFLYFE